MKLYRIFVKDENEKVLNGGKPYLIQDNFFVSDLKKLIWDTDLAPRDDCANLLTPCHFDVIIGNKVLNDNEIIKKAFEEPTTVGNKLKIDNLCKPLTLSDRGSYECNLVFKIKNDFKYCYNKNLMGEWPIRSLYTNDKKEELNVKSCEERKQEIKI